METIKVQWELTPSQRSELLNALLLLQKRRLKESAQNDTTDIEILIGLTSRLKCGDPNCSFCGDPIEEHIESEPDPEEEYGARIDYEYEKWRDQ
jgi:hypothetical protein